MALKVTDIDALYLTIFNRVPEKNGQKAWIAISEAQNMDMAKAAQTMIETEASKEYFAGVNTNFEFMEHIYKNLLGKDRTQDEAGIKAWANWLDIGKSKGETVAAMLKTAMENDFSKIPNAQDAVKAQNLLLNKIKIAEISAQFADNIVAGTNIKEQIAPFVEVASKAKADMTVLEAIVQTASILIDGKATTLDRVDSFKSDIAEKLYNQLISGKEYEKLDGALLSPNISQALFYVSRPNAKKELLYSDLRDANWDQTLLKDVGFAGIGLNNPAVALAGVTGDAGGGEIAQ